MPFWDWLRFRRKEPSPADEEGHPAPYRVYTTEFDEEIAARDLIKRIFPSYGARRSELVEIQQAMRAPSGARARAIQTALDFQERLRSGHALGEKPLVTLLIDHSGSTRGAKAAAAALTADIVGSLLEEEGILFEVLGFTTRSWRGGQSRLQWSSRGKPKLPGRLCDLLHIVYHAANDTQKSWVWDLALLQCDDLLKENVDGEALAWARSRAAVLNPSNWICIMISDGASVDDCTLTHNPPDTLQRHLLKIIDEVRTQQSHRLGGLGLQYDVSRYYPVSDQAAVLADAPTVALGLLGRLNWPTASDEAG